jgi:hypothetical protein
MVAIAASEPRLYPQRLLAAPLANLLPTQWLWTMTHTLNPLAIARP